MGCGPDPHAQLPGAVSLAQAGGATGNGGTTTRTVGAGGAGGTTDGSGGAVSSGGSVGNGGTTPSQGGTSVVNPFVGGTTGSTGGIVSSGGTLDSGGVLGTGGVASTGGIAGSGGAVGTGGDLGIDGGGGGSEPCAPAKTITGSGSGNSGSFGTTGAYCFRTPDNVSGWNCSNFTGRTLKVNGVTTTCGAASLPAKVNGYYYFDATAGGVDYASIYWY